MWIKYWTKYDIFATINSLAIIKQNMEDWEKSLAVELSTGEAEMMTLEELETSLAKHNDDANLYL